MTCWIRFQPWYCTKPVVRPDHYCADNQGEEGFLHDVQYSSVHLVMFSSTCGGNRPLS